MRRHALEVERSPLTAIIIALGYLGGFRPGEWRAMRWHDVRQATITVHESTDPDGRCEGPPRRSTAPSTCGPSSPPTCGPGGAVALHRAEDPVIPNGRRMHWDDEEYKRWGAAPSSAPPAPPAGRTPRRTSSATSTPPAHQGGRLDAREIAERMGHSVEMLERRYAHEIREYRGRRIDVQARSAWPAPALRRLRRGRDAGDRVVAHDGEAASCVIRGSRSASSQAPGRSAGAAASPYPSQTRVLSLRVSLPTAKG
jgi:hypothetical protein